MSTLKTNNIQHVDRSEPSILIDTSGSVSIAGTLTYEDVTNIDSVGIITARSDVSIADKIVHTGDTNTAIRFPANDTFTVETSGVERLRINSGGEVLIGDDTSEITMGLNANVQIFGTNASESSFAIKRGSNDAQAAFFVLSKSRNTSVGSRTILNDGDEVGNIFFVADDGTDLLSETAAIKSQINGAPGANDTPGNLSFWTTSDGANAATRRMTITSAGNIGINESSPSHKLVVGGDIGVGFNTPNDAARQINFNVNRGSAGQTLANINWQWNSKYVAQIRGMAGADTTNKDDGNLTFYTSAANSLVERLRITSAGSVTIGGETSPDWKLTVYDAGYTGVTIKTNRSGSTENIGGLHFKTQSTNVAYFQSLVDGTLKFRNTSSLTERLRIDTSGRLLIGHDTGNGYPQLSVSGNTAGASGAGMLFLRRGLTRSAIGSNVGADLGEIDYGDLDGNIYASIQGKTDAATGSSDYPGRLIFATTADGASSPTERIRILSGGQVNIGGLYSQTSYGFSVRGGAVDQNVQFSNTKSTNGNIHYFGITLTNAGYGQALFGHTGHTTAGDQAAWMGNSGDDVAGGVGVKVFRGGSVIKKGQPAFMAYGGADSTSSGNYLVVTTEVFDVRGDYNNSTGVFTAPIAGKYLFTITGLYTKNNASPPFKLTWHVNNSNSGVAAEWQDASISNSYNTIGNSSIIFNLAESDTVRLYIEGSTFHISGLQTRLCGYLLG